MRTKASLVFFVGLMLRTLMPSAPAIVGAQNQDASESQIYKVGSGVSPPRPTYQPEPQFSEEARAACYQGVITLATIVEKDGTTSHTRVTSSLGMGLDEKAIEAVRQWRFWPATKDGEPVRAEIAVEVAFRMYGGDHTICGITQKANAGDAKAQLELADIYFGGKGVAKNENLGESYLQRAANQNLPQAQFQLGERLARRDPPDYPKAYMWFTLAQRGGEKHSDKPLKKLSAKMTPEQRQSGKTLADNWTPPTK